MTDNGVVQTLESIIRRYKDVTHYVSCIVDINILKKAINLINRQKAQIERLNKDCEDVIYKLEYLLCTATGNKFSKHTYPIGDMVSYVNDYIQDCCNEAVEEAKEAVKSEAIKEFAERFAKALSEFDMSSVGLPDYDRGYENCMTAIEDTIDNLVKEMTKETTKVEKNQRKEDEKNV